VILRFKLSMPTVGSWDGKWSDEGVYYAIVRSLQNKELANKILERDYYHYDFGDGWAAGITVEQIDSKEAAKTRRRSKGFCGYEWMVDSIINNQRIAPPLSTK
jgi:hypothetical protein